ncbi:MAG TPA: hypothetical protein VH165_00575 [Kofleriaceae bacterium]|jgi:hypothetical protein|nr:hypothetical protein [Kofleriaceae bacterium]
MASKKKPASAKAAVPQPDGPGDDETVPSEVAEPEPEPLPDPESPVEPPARAPAAARIEASEPAPARPAPARPAGSGAGPTRTTAALEHGTAASGAKLVKPGFATTKAGDLAFALGFPHLEYIVDDHPDDARAEMIAYERRGYRIGWPRNVAIRWCRITASKGFKRTPQGATELDTAGKKALKNGTPLTAEEVGLTLKSMFSDTSSYEDLQDLVRLFEAFMGPELIASSIVDALEKSSNNVWNHQDHDRAQALRHTGFLLLRLPASLADKLRGRLAAIFDRRVKALPTKELGPRKGERGSLLRALDLVLNGRAGVERSGERDEDMLEPADLVHITNDPAFVCEAARQRVSVDSRMVFLGGEPVLERMIEVFPRFRGMHPQLLDSFAEVASPRAVELLQRIAKGKEVAERAQAVLAARGL